MKSSIITLSILFSSLCFGQNFKFQFGAFQNIGHTAAKYNNYDPTLKPDFENINYAFEGFRSNYGINGAVIFSPTKDSLWFFRIGVNISLNDDKFMANSGYINSFEREINKAYSLQEDTIVRDNSNKLAMVTTRNHAFNISFNKKVSTYLSVGAGVAFNYRESSYDEIYSQLSYSWRNSTGNYQFDGSKDRLTRKDVSDLSVMYPVNVNLHFPLGKIELGLFNSLMLAKGSGTFFQTNFVVTF